MENLDIEAINNKLSLNHSMEEVLEYAFDSFRHIALSFSGAEDVALLDMAWKVDPDLKVFTLDTGRLHVETYEFLEKIRSHYQIEIEILTPPSSLLSSFVTKKGLFSFFEDGHQQCCSIRKVASLKRKVLELDAWITGQRQDQSDTRVSLPIFQQDLAFSDENKKIYKFNPLAYWTREQVWAYIEKNNVPYNSLHDIGYKSIGCQPCSKPVKPDEHERLGRWWWEDASEKECGLHVSK